MLLGGENRSSIIIGANSALLPCSGPAVPVGKTVQRVCVCSLIVGLFHSYIDRAG